MIMHTFDNWKRITKSEAQKRFNAGKETRIVPHKCSPDSPFAGDMMKHFNNPELSQCFQSAINAWCYYNSRWETGYYPSFYVKEGE